jgi:hypothetical protein
MRITVVGATGREAIDGADAVLHRSDERRKSPNHVTEVSR